MTTVRPEANRTEDAGADETAIVATVLASTAESMEVAFLLDSDLIVEGSACSLSRTRSDRC